jgi:hypothetical protein
MRSKAKLLLLLTATLVGADEPGVVDKVLPAAGDCRCSAQDAEGGKDRAGNDIKAIPASEQGLKVFTPDECCVVCSRTPECDFYSVSTEADGTTTICWLKKAKGPVTGDKASVAASLSPQYKSDPGYCHAYPTTFGGRFLSAFVLAGLVYTVGGALYGQRVLHKQHAGTLLAAHPHSQRWVEFNALVRDGAAFARGRRHRQAAPSRASTDSLAHPDTRGGVQRREGKSSGRNSKHRSGLADTSSVDRSKKSKRGGTSRAAAQPLLASGDSSGGADRDRKTTEHHHHHHHHHQQQQQQHRHNQLHLVEEHEHGALHQSQAKIKIVTGLGS